MALLDRFTAVSISNGCEFNYTRISATRFKEEYVTVVSGKYKPIVNYFTEGAVQSALTSGKLTITNPATLDSSFEERPLPQKFYFATAKRLRYTAYIQDDVVTVALGEGVATETWSYTLTRVKEFVKSGLWVVLPESYRTANSVAAEFMQFMENHQGPLTIEDRVAMAETIVVLNKVMYEMESK